MKLEPTDSSATMISHLLVYKWENGKENLSSCVHSQHRRPERAKQRCRDREFPYMTGSATRNGSFGQCNDALTTSLLLNYNMHSSFTVRQPCALTLLPEASFLLSEFQPSLNRKRCHISLTSKLANLKTNYSMPKAYAGAKFTSPPSPELLPLPPLHWRLDLSISRTLNCRNSQCSEIANVIKGLLQI